MTTQPIALVESLSTIIKRAPTVEVQELSICSPTGAKRDVFMHGVVEVIGKSLDSFVDTSQLLAGMSLKRPYSGGHRRSPRPEARRRSSSLGTSDGSNVKDNGKRSQREVSAAPLQARGVDSATSSVLKVGKDKSKDDSRKTSRDRPSPSEQSAAPSNLLGPLPARGWFNPSQLLGQAGNGPPGINAPLTPPEDHDSFKWESLSQIHSTDGIHTASNNEQSQQQGQTQSLHRTSSASRPSGIQLPEPSDMAGGDSSSPNWLGRACQPLGKMSPVSLGTNLLISLV